MRRNVLATLLIPAALAVVVLFGAAVTSVSATSPSVGSQQEIVFDGGAGDQYLADALGISLEELQSAYETAADAALDQAVAEGWLTQAQADRIRERGGGFPFFGGRLGAWFGESEIDYNALLADALGITVDELNSARQEAHLARIEQAVADGNLTEEEADLLRGRFALYHNESFQRAMRTAFEDAVNRAVEDGVITQAQADQILSRPGGLRIGGFGGMRGFGNRRGMGRMGGGMWFGGPCLNPDAALPNAAPSGSGL